jgi:hypothetical protein
MTLRWLSRLLSLLKLQWPSVDFGAIRIVVTVEEALGADLALSAQPNLGFVYSRLYRDFSACEALKLNTRRV